MRPVARPTLAAGAGTCTMTRVNRARSLLLVGVLSAGMAACASAGPTPSPAAPSALDAVPATTAPSLAATPTAAPTATPPATPTPTPGPTFAENVPFTPMIPCAADPKWEDAICQLDFDIAVPPAGTGTHPIAVLFRGGPDKPHAIDYLRDTATALADRGIVALVADWRESDAYAGTGEVPFEDVACAIGVARKIGPQYGGDPDHVTLIGHSNGSWGGGVVALSHKEFTPAAGACDETAGALRPEAYISVEGWFPPELAATDPRRPKHPIPVLVIQSEGDPVVFPSDARELVAELRKRGYAPQLVMLPGGDHISALYDKATLDRMAAFAKG
jgi:dienelactone hydrolase